MSQNNRNSRPAPRPAPESADPSGLYGLIFPRALRDFVWTKAVELFGYKPVQRDAYVAADYHFLRLLEAVGERMIEDAEKAMDGGKGWNAAYADFLDFKSQVSSMVVEPRRDQRPAPQRRDDRRPTSAPRPEDKSGSTLGDTLSPEKKAELAATVIPPRPSAEQADAAPAAPRSKHGGKGNGKASQEVASA